MSLIQRMMRTIKRKTLTFVITSIEAPGRINPYKIANADLCKCETRILTFERPCPVHGPFGDR